MVPQDSTKHQPARVYAAKELGETDPHWWFARAKSSVIKWRREYAPDEDEALAEAREAYRRCAELEGPRGENIKVQAQVGLARLDFVVGDPASIRSGLARLAEVLRDHPYNQHIEEVIYFLAIPAAFPQTEQSTATAMGALEYLDYLRDSYAPSKEGAPTAMMYPRWDTLEQEECDSERDGIVPGDAERWEGKGLQVHGLPAWALQFQIGLLASRLGYSTRGMETMENAFTSYEAWLPRSRGQFNDGTPDADAIRRSWYNGLPHWTAWVQHPRTWLDLGDIAYRQGVGCFHVAAEAYRGALKRAGNLFPPDQQESIVYRIAKCCSRCGDLAGAVSGIEELLYTRNFWSERYSHTRNHLKAWSEAWRVHFNQEDTASLRLQCFWRVTAAKMELHSLRAQARLVLEYTELKRRNVLKHYFQSILRHCRARQRVSRFATLIQCRYRIHRACARAVTARSARDFREAIVLAHASKLIRNFQVVCWKHWKKHHDMVRLDKAAAQIQALLRGTKARAVARFILAARKSRDLLEQLVENMHDKCLARRVLRRLSKQVMVGRRERAATTVQAMARGVVGREIACDERNRQARINELLLNALRRLGTPVFREWYKAAHNLRRARMSIKVQSRWRTFRAMRALTLTKTKVSRAHEMGILAIGRNQLADKRRVVETLKRTVLERNVVAVQGMARIWLAKRVMSRRRMRQEELRRLFMRVTKPIRRRCFVALARNRTTCRKNKKALVLVIQCWWRCRHALGITRRAREYRNAIHSAYDAVVTNHERRLLIRCCREWRENIPKQKAATKIQGAWRGWEGRLRAAWFKDREVGFEEFAQVLRAVSRQVVRKVAFKEWRTLAWLSRMTTKLSARYRGTRARTAFAAKMSTLRRQQGALCRVAVAKRRLYLVVATRLWSDHCYCSQMFSVFQARIRGWLARRRLTATKSFTRETTEMFILGGIRNLVQLHATCCTSQAAWRGVLARERCQRVQARARVVGEIIARVTDARRRRVLGNTMNIWCWTRSTEKRMAICLQAVFRGRRGRARACSVKAHQQWRDDLVARFQQEVLRRRKLRCFRAVEACLVEAYATTFRSFASDKRKVTAVHAERRISGKTATTHRGDAWECNGSSPRDPDHALPSLGESHNSPQSHRTGGQRRPENKFCEGDSLCRTESSTTALALEGDSHTRRHSQHPSTYFRDPVPVGKQRRTTAASPGRSRRGSGKDVIRQRRPVGRDIVWEAENGGKREAGKCPTSGGMWLSNWVAARERSTDFVSSTFFRAFDEVRRRNLLRWLPGQLSCQELSFLCRYARVIVLDPAPAVEVWKLVVVLRNALYQDPTFDGPETGVTINAPPTEGCGLPASGTGRPAVILCNGEYSGDVGQTGVGAVAALVDGGVDTMVCSPCSSLSATACSLGNGGAMAIAKACCGGNLEKLSLENCGIGNPGATALALALGEGATAKDRQLRKLVLSGNRIGGVVACARALRNVLIRTPLDVLELSRCSVTDADLSIISKGLVDARCRLRVLQLSGNIDLRDRGVNDLAEALRARSEMHDGTRQSSLQVDLHGCSVNTWGCRALASSVLDINNEGTHHGVGATAVTVNLGYNSIKDVGVEAMSCASLGQEYEDHKKRQSNARRQKHHQSKSPGVLDAARVHKAQEFGSGRLELRCEPTGDLPPLTGTPLYAAATAAWPDTRHEDPRVKGAPPSTPCSVVLDGNRVSDRVAAGQGGLAGLGEAALFRGCVLPETIVSNTGWTRDSFWTKTRGKSTLGSSQGCQTSNCLEGKA